MQKNRSKQNRKKCFTIRETYAAVKKEREAEHVPPPGDVAEVDDPDEQCDFDEEKDIPKADDAGLMML